MKKFRIIILLLLVLFLSGCSGTYNIKINNDLSVDEDLEISIENQNEDVFDTTKKLFSNNNISAKKYKVTASSNVVSISYKEKYKSIEDYILNSKLYHQLYDNINYSFVDGIINLKTTGKMYLTDDNNNYIFNNYDISLLQINLEVPFKILDNNADIDSEDTLSWTLNKDTREKDINVKLDVIGSRSNYKEIIILSIVFLILAGTAVVFIIRFRNERKL